MRIEYLILPAGTPKAIVAKLNKEVVAALRNPQTARMIANRGAEAEGTSSEEFGQYLRSEIAKWSKVIKDAGVKQR